MPKETLPSPDSLIGRVLANRYLIEELLESSPHGACYRAYHLGLDRQLLLRILPGRGGLSRAACQRALQMGHRISALETPCVARTLDVGWHQERYPFLVCDLLPGTSLELAAQSGPFELARVVAIGQQLAMALQCAHAVGITHGGLAADCCWLEPGGVRRERARLLGFGVAALPPADGDGPKSGIFPSPRAAEPAALSNFRNEVRCDIQALGAMLQRLATGHEPGWDEPANDGGVAFGETREPRASLARGFAALAQRCVQLPLAGGYEHAGQLTRDLTALERSATAAATVGDSAPVTSVHRPAARGAPLGAPPAKVIVRRG